MISECRHHASLENSNIVRYHNAWIEFDQTIFPLKKTNEYEGYVIKDKVCLNSSSSEVPLSNNLIFNENVSSSLEDSNTIIKGKFWRKPIEEINNSTFTLFSTNSSGHLTTNIEENKSLKNDINCSNINQPMVAYNIKNVLLNNCSEVNFLNFKHSYFCKF